jgi:hypothetical protein
LVDQIVDVLPACQQSSESGFQVQQPSQATAVKRVHRIVLGVSIKRE